MAVDHTEAPYGGEAVIRLRNHDKALIGIDWQGLRVDIGYGFITDSGEEYSSAAPLWVYGQRDVSEKGELNTELVCIDIWQRLAYQVMAGAGKKLSGTVTGDFRLTEKVTGATSGAYGFVTSWRLGQSFIIIGRVTGTFQAGETVNGADGSISNVSVADISGGIPAAYDGDSSVKQIIADCLAGLTTVTEDTTDPNDRTNTTKPTDYLVAINTDALSIIQELVAMTRSALRMQQDSMHLFYIDPSSSVDYSYDTVHAFFSDVRRRQLVLPNLYVVLDSREDVTAIGSASDSGSIAKFGIVPRVEIDPTVTTNDEATTRAQILLEREQAQTATGTLIVPHNCGQELYDYIKIEDSRSGLTGANAIYGRVGQLIHRYAPGIYQLEISLGSLSRELRTTEVNLPETDLRGYSIGSHLDVLNRENGVPMIPWEDYLPKSIQGYQHNITFSATDWDTVAWTSGTVKFYDGTTQSISSGSVDLSSDAIRYIYFDLNDASPSVLKVTTDYQSVMTEYTGLVCLVQRGSNTGIKARFIPSYGKEPLITADWIDMTGIKSYTYPDGTLIQSLFSTQVQAGYIKLTSSTVVDSGFTLDKVYDGSTYQRVKATELSSGVIKLHSGTIKSGIWYNESGVIIDATSGIAIKGVNMAFRTQDAYGNTQCYMGSDGKIYAGAGNVWLSSTELGMKGATFKLYSGAVQVGTIDGNALGLFITSSGNYDIQVTASGSGNLDLAAGTAIRLYKQLVAQGSYMNTLYDIYPQATNAWLGTSVNKWAAGYFSSLPSCPEGLPTQASGLDVVKKVKKPQPDADGKLSFKDADFPDEMKVDVVEKSVEEAVYETRMEQDADGFVRQKKLEIKPRKVNIVPTGRKEIEYIRTIGVLVQAVKELAERVEALESR
jgi:hypothetical protein